MKGRTRTTGTIARGIRAPLVRAGDDPVEVVVEALRRDWSNEGYRLRDRDVVGITESLIARAQDNYVTVDRVAGEAAEKFGRRAAVVFPILSRNRFSLILRGLARGLDEISLFLRYPSDEVGNPLIAPEALSAAGGNPAADLFTEQAYRKLCGGRYPHPFTGIDYVELYRRIVEDEGARCSIFLSNRPEHALRHCPRALAADIHTREATEGALRAAGARTVYSLADFCREKRSGGGYNPRYGLLGSNKAGEERLKLFPRIRGKGGKRYVEQIRERLKDLTGKQVEAMIYGDGAFKDPAAGIWELADPVVAVDFTKGLKGTPRELKLKYLIDSRPGGEEAVREQLLKAGRRTAAAASQGTTPRRLTDLLGSLCDLVSGSGGKGTPIVLVQGYFDSWADG